MPEETLQLSDDRGFWFAVVDIEVIKDQALSLTDKAIYAILCAFSSVGDNRSSRPSIGTIAEAACCSKNTVRTAIKNLVSRGVIEREERFCDGRQTSCLYKIIGHKIYGRGSNIEGGRVQNLKGEGSKYDTQELEPKELEPKDIPPISPKKEEISEPSENTDQDLPKESEEKPTVPVNPLDDWFDKFWKHYPKPVDKKRAKRTFMAIFSRASPKKQRARMENLILRLTRYVADRKDEDPKYTKNPTTWLNSHDFDDTPGEAEILYSTVWKEE